MEDNTIALDCNLLYDANGRRTQVQMFLARSVEPGADLPDFKGEWLLSYCQIFTCYYCLVDFYPKHQTLWICQTGGGVENKIGVGSFCSISGDFEVICKGEDRYAKRLKEWWKAGDRSERYARLCAKYLKPRITKIPESELEFLAQSQPRLTDAVLGDDEFSKWLSTAAVLGGKRVIEL